MNNSIIQIFLVKSEKKSTFARKMTKRERETAATIGFFDGVHLGHRFLLEQLLKLAAERDMQTVVVTFDRHPREVLCPGWQPQLLTSPEEKQELLRQTGVDRLTVLPFNPQLAALSAYDFMRQVLKEQLGVGLLLTGYDNRFGHRTAGSAEGFDDYVSYGQELGIEVMAGTGLQVQDERLEMKEERCRRCVSSSLIRQLLSQGRVGEAARCLGRPYELKGTVVHGEQQGRLLGFPTANLSLDTPLRMVPANGVYAVQVKTAGGLWKGMTNIGLRPTFDGHRQTIETHILDFKGDLYGQPVTIAFRTRLRDEQHFSSPEQLAHQMEKDAQRARQMMSGEG